MPGNAVWLQEAVTAHGDGLLRLCFLYLGDRQAAEDAVQETFLKAYQAHGRFRGDCSEKTWLTRIAINQCKTLLRKRRLSLPGGRSLSRNMSPASGMIRWSRLFYPFRARAVK